MEEWLGALVRGGGLSGLAVVHPGTPLTGYAVRGGPIQAWSASLDPAGPKMETDHVRTVIHGGFATVQGARYGDIGAAISVRMKSVIHLHVDGDVLVSEPIVSADPEYNGHRAILPGLGAGILVRPVLGVIQPYRALTAGLWFAARDEGLIDSTEGSGAR